MAHAILNIEDNVSVTENYFLINSLDDMIHGMMMGENVLDLKPHQRQRLWKCLYFKLLKKKDRVLARYIIDQIEEAINTHDDACL